MTTLGVEPRVADVVALTLTDDELTAELSDGRKLSLPLSWYPRLVFATQEERANWRLIGHGEGIHWPDLDEDISAANLVLGQPSGESQASLDKWLRSRERKKRP